MLEVVRWFQELALDGRAGSFAVALGVVCLLQYGAHLWATSRTRRENREIRRELDKVVDRLTCLESDRALAEAESSALRLLAGSSSLEGAVAVLLDYFAAEPEFSFAAYFDVTRRTPRLQASRGLSSSSQRMATLDDEWLRRVTAEAAISLAPGESREGLFFEALAPDDRDKLSQLTLVRVGPAEAPAGVLATTRLPPESASLPGRLELAKRLAAGVAGQLARVATLEVQQEELRLTRELLDLRCLVDQHLGSPVELLEEFLKRVLEATGFDRAVLHLASGNRLDAKPLVNAGAPLPRGIADLWKLDETTLARQGLRGEGLLFYDAADLHALRVRSTMCGAMVGPLVHESTLIGVVCLARQSDAPISAADRELLRWATDYLRDTILRTVDRAIIEQQARRDALTHLANRHTFDREIERHVEQALRTGDQCALIMLDLDRFKALNDKYGHLAGDEALRSVARLVQNGVVRTRVTDRPLVARYGGEELVVLLPGVGADGACRIADEIVAAVREATIEHQGLLLRLTISGGVASCPEHGLTASEVIAAADAALYQAKSNGRDRKEVAVARGPAQTDASESTAVAAW